MLASDFIRGLELSDGQRLTGLRRFHNTLLRGGSAAGGNDDDDGDGAAGGGGFIKINDLGETIEEGPRKGGRRIKGTGAQIAAEAEFGSYLDGQYRADMDLGHIAELDPNRGTDEDDEVLGTDEDLGTDEVLSTDEDLGTDQSTKRKN